MRDVISYIAATDSEFPSRIEGAADAEIDHLEGMVRIALPADYRQFLSQLGNNDGGLRIGHDSSTRIHDIEAYYSDVLSDDDWEEMIPSNSIVIAYSGIRTPELSLDFGVGSAPRVIFSSGARKLGNCAESLEKLVFRAAFSNFRRKLAPRSAIYEAEADTVSMDAVASAVARFGFAAEWFTDDVCYCGSNGRVLLLFQRILGRPLWLRLSAERDDELHEWGGRIERELGLVFRATVTFPNA